MTHPACSVLADLVPLPPAHFAALRTKGTERSGWCTLLRFSYPPTLPIYTSRNQPSEHGHDRLQPQLQQLFQHLGR